jgi:hypothetical protein
LSFGTITALLGVSGMQRLIGASAHAAPAISKNTVRDTAAALATRRTSNSLIEDLPLAFR